MSENQLNDRPETDPIPAFPLYEVVVAGKPFILTLDEAATQLYEHGTSSFSYGNIVIEALGERRPMVDEDQKNIAHAADILELLKTDPRYTPQTQQPPERDLFPQYQLHVDGKDQWLTLERAADAFFDGKLHEGFGDSVIDAEGAPPRPMTNEDREKIIQSGLPFPTTSW
jgi:hypothetical protein